MVMKHFLSFACLCLLAFANAFAADRVTVYPESPLPRAGEFSVKANGHDIAVYNAGTFRCAPFAFSGTVTVEITYRGGTIRSYQINPVSKGVVARQDDSTLVFTLTTPQKLEIQINGATSQAVDGDELLYLFADAPEVNVPKPDDRDVIYFGPGNHGPGGGEMKIDDANPHSAMYLAPGAVLNASLVIARTKPFKLCGRGFIQNPFTTKGHYAIGMKDCVGLKVEDVVFFNSNWHGLKFLGGHGNVVRNVKTLHYLVNSDTQNPLRERQDIRLIDGVSRVRIRSLIQNPHRVGPGIEQLIDQLHVICSRAGRGIVGVRIGHLRQGLDGLATTTIRVASENVAGVIGDDK